MRRVIGIILMCLAIPLGLYVWLKWGWYDGFVLAFNGLMNDPKSATDFAWGVCKVLIGGAAGALIGWLTFFGGLIIGSD